MICHWRLAFTFRGSWGAEPALRAFPISLHKCIWQADVQYARKTLSISELLPEETIAELTLRSMDFRSQTNHDEVTRTHSVRESRKLRTAASPALFKRLQVSKQVAHLFG